MYVEANGKHRVTKPATATRVTTDNNFLAGALLFIGGVIIGWSLTTLLHMYLLH